MLCQIQVNIHLCHIQVNYLLHNLVCGYESTTVTVINKRRNYVALMYA